VKQGLSANVHDVSPDEAGNVYVAGGDAVYAKRRDDGKFLRFDSANAGLTVNCNDQALEQQEHPTQPFYQCQVLSVGGASSGSAVIGFDGFETESGGTPNFDWVLLGNGGADVVAFDGAAGTLTRVRHVDVGSPPGVICSAAGGEVRGNCSDPGNYWWVYGRHLHHKIDRIVVNHDKSTAMYGDAWMCGEHGTFSVLLANSDARGYHDYTAGQDPKYKDERNVWEHLHPAFVQPNVAGSFVNGECTALALDPKTGWPWGSNRFRTVRVDGYGPDLHNDNWWMFPGTEPTYIDIWPDPSRDLPFGASYDDVSSMSFCPDGTLWVASLAHGLAQLATDGTILRRLDLPDASLHDSVASVLCDPVDGSLWLGLGVGGVARLRNGTLQIVNVPGQPDFASHPVPSIQLDPWASPRILYFAFQSTGPLAAPLPGGVAAYDGP
jgi:hypothetical protein